MIALVRHAESAADPATPARTWGLTPAGRRAAEALEDGMAVCTGGRALCAVHAHLTGTDGWALWQTLAMPQVLTVDGPSVASTR